MFVCDDEDYEVAQRLYIYTRWEPFHRMSPAQDFYNVIPQSYRSAPLTRRQRRQLPFHVLKAPS